MATRSTRFTRGLVVAAAVVLLAAWQSAGDECDGEPTLGAGHGRQAQRLRSTRARSAKRREDHGGSPTPRSAPRSLATAEQAGTSGAAGAASLPQTSAPVREPEPVFGELLSRWQTERVDPEWTRTVEEELRGSMSALAVRAEIVDVSCRSTLCRAQLAFADAGEAGRYAAEGTDPSRRRWFTTRTAADRFEVDVVLPRETAPSR